MTLTEHLGELRMRIIRCALAVTIGAIVSHRVLRPGAALPHASRTPTCARHAARVLRRGRRTTAPRRCTSSARSRASATRMRIAMYGGMHARHAGRAVADLALRRAGAATPTRSGTRSRSSCRRSALFLLGGLLAYLTLEQGARVPHLVGGSDVGRRSRSSKYVRLVGLMVAAFGIGFQFPVLLVFLQLVGVLTPQQLIEWWRYAIVGIVVVAAVITPSGDPISLAALAVPMTSSTSSPIVVGWLVPAAEAPRGRGRAEQTAARL